jgi:hypothetical protein
MVATISILSMGVVMEIKNKAVNFKFFDIKLIQKSPYHGKLNEWGSYTFNNVTLIHSFLRKKSKV